MIKVPDDVSEKIRSSQKTLFILCGLPYSGKTYLCEQLKERASISVVRIDDIFQARGFDWDKNILPDEKEWGEIFERSYEQIVDSFSQSDSVVHDSTNHTRASREKLREVARKVGATTIILYIRVPTNVIWDRWERNVVSRSRSVVAKNLIEMTIDTFEPPTPDEGAVVEI